MTKTRLYHDNFQNYKRYGITRGSYGGNVIEKLIGEGENA